IHDRVRSIIHVVPAKRLPLPERIQYQDILLLLRRVCPLLCLHSNTFQTVHQNHCSHQDETTSKHFPFTPSYLLGDLRHPPPLLLPSHRRAEL
ncbi:hypothetical protein pipiens_017752, partial [Culex pipiens pipiens]